MNPDSLPIHPCESVAKWKMLNRGNNTYDHTTI